MLFLGTAGAAPTAQRGLTAFLVRRGGVAILIDCGEGTQRQMLRSGAGLVDVDEILLTHLHADHYLGLPGMLKTFALRGREAPLRVYGPSGLETLMRVLHPVIGRVGYELELVELEPADWIGHEEFRIESFATSHDIPSLGYALVEDERPGRFDLDEARRLGVPEGPAFGRLQRGETVVLDSGEEVTAAQVLGETRRGRRVVFSGDTRPCPAMIEASAAADVLIHEATFLEDEAVRARQTGHTTARQAGRIATDAQVTLLAVTHLSTRYMPREIRDEARSEFANTVVPRDFDSIDLPLPERGDPQLVRADG